MIIQFLIMDVRISGMKVKDMLLLKCMVHQKVW